MFAKLREMRQAKGFSCAYMADKLGFTKSTYHKKECGQIVMTLKDAQTISVVLNKSIDDIFGNKNEGDK